VLGWSVDLVGRIVMLCRIYSRDETEPTRGQDKCNHVQGTVSKTCLTFKRGFLLTARPPSLTSSIYITADRAGPPAASPTPRAQRSETLSLLSSVCSGAPLSLLTQKAPVSSLASTITHPEPRSHPFAPFDPSPIPLAKQNIQTCIHGTETRIEYISGIAG
jgi:hypothetical protein